MTLSFVFTDFFPLLIISNIVGDIFTVLCGIFLIKAGKNQDEEIQYAKLLIYGGIIAIIFVLLGYVVPFISISEPYSKTETIIFIGYTIFRNLLFIIPNIFAYGIIFVLFGYKNKDTFKPYLLIAGILWIIMEVIGSLNSSIIVLFTFDVEFIYSIAPISLAIVYSSFGATFISYILILVHGIKHDDKNLKFVGLINIVGFIIGLVLPFLTPTLHALFMPMPY